MGVCAKEPRNIAGLLYNGVVQTIISVKYCRNKELLVLWIHPMADFNF